MDRARGGTVGRQRWRFGHLARHRVYGRGVPAVEVGGVEVCGEIERGGRRGRGVGNGGSVEENKSLYTPKFAHSFRKSPAFNPYKRPIFPTFFPAPAPRFPVFNTQPKEPRGNLSLLTHYLDRYIPFPPIPPFLPTPVSTSRH